MAFCLKELVLPVIFVDPLPFERLSAHGARRAKEGRLQRKEVQAYEAANSFLYPCLYPYFFKSSHSSDS